MDKSLKEITDTLVRFAYNFQFTDSNAEQALDYVADVLAQGRLSLSDMRRLAYAFMCKSLEAEVMLNPTTQVVGFFTRADLARSPILPCISTSC